MGFFNGGTTSIIKVAIMQDIWQHLLMPHTTRSGGRVAVRCELWDDLSRL